MQQVLGSFGFLAAGVTGESEILFLLELVAGEFDFGRINYDDKIPAIDMWRIIGLVLTFQNGSYFSTHASNGLIGTIHNVPVVLNGSRVSMFGGEM
jgi:hypothetical protein